MVKEIFRRNQDIILILLAYFIIERLVIFQPVFREVFKDNPDVSHFWPWFFFQFGMHLWLLGLLFRAPFRLDSTRAYTVWCAIVLLLFVRTIFVFNVLYGIFEGPGVRPNLVWLWFFMNAGDWKILWGIPKYLSYLLISWEEFAIWSIIIIVNVTALKNLVRIFIIETWRNRGPDERGPNGNTRPERNNNRGNPRDF
jgi:hypothetical protein